MAQCSWKENKGSPRGTIRYTVQPWIPKVFGKVKVLVAQLCPTLCNPMYCILPGSSVHGIFQARILEWVTIPFSRGSSKPRDWTWVSCIAGTFFTHLSHQGSPKSLWGVIKCVCVCARSIAQSCLTLYDPMDCSPPGSSVHRIAQSWTLLKQLSTEQHYTAMI